MLVDGAPCHEDWALDRGLHYGDGLFETLIARNGVIRFEALHRNRLSQGCRRLDIAVDEDTLWHQARTLAAQHGNAVLKILVTRGTALARGYTPSNAAQARSVLLAYDAPDPTEIPACVRVVTLRECLGENPALAGMKHCNRLEQVLARAQLKTGNAFEGLMGSSSGRLISGTMSNVFLELDGELVTPMLDQCGIAGVMRAVVLREAQRIGMHIRVADLPLAAANSCTAMFLTNARLGVLAVQQLDGRPLAHGDGVRRLAERIEGLEH
jgi:4-amino-4-deoxychorismate lyase